MYPIGIPTDKEEKAKKVREDWIKTLPDFLNNDGVKVEIDKVFFMFVDPYGNNLLPLPSKPVTDIQAYFNNNFKIPE